MVTNNAGNIPTGATSTVLIGQGVGTAPAFSAAPTVTSITFGAGSALDTYATATFTPVLAFGGASVGITYSTQAGKYWKIGSMVFYAISIILTSKGSSVGAATITGLPFASATDSISLQTPCVTAVGVTLDATYTQVGAYQTGASSALTLWEFASTTGGFAGLANTNFANTTQFYVTGAYWTT